MFSSATKDARFGYLFVFWGGGGDFSFVRICIGLNVQVGFCADES